MSGLGLVLLRRQMPRAPEARKAERRQEAATLRQGSLLLLLTYDGDEDAAFLPSPLASPVKA